MIAPMSSPSRSVDIANAPTAETSRICEVCDRSDGVVEYWRQGAWIHETCAPGHWRKDRREAEAFFAATHRIRYELEDSGKISAVCLKCDWWLSDWPNRVDDVYRKAQKHIKGDRDSS